MDEKQGNGGLLEQAAAYLQGNAELRAAVGACAGDVLEPQRLGEGEHNLNYRFRVPSTDATYVLRVNVAAQPFHDNQIAYEFAALQALAPSGCTPAPVFLDDTPAALGKGVLVEEFLPGAELDFDNLQPGQVESAVRLMADVHAVPVAPDCPLHRPADPLSELFAECVERFRLYRASAFEDARITRWGERFIEAAENGLRSSTPPSAEDRAHIVNTEPLPSHFLLPHQQSQQNADRLAPSSRGSLGRGADDASSPLDVVGEKGPSVSRGAFIDWERAIVGEAAQDVAYFTAPTTTFWDSEYLMTRDAAAEAVEQYWRAVDGRFARGSFDERYRLYRMMTALRSVTWCCRALITYGAGSAAHQTSKAAAKLPVYLSDDFMDLVARECFE